MTKIIYGHATSYEIESNVSKSKHDLVVVGAKGKSSQIDYFWEVFQIILCKH